MSATGGYDSDVNLQDIQFVGDFPLENSLGGFGLTTGTGNNYVLGLNPTITTYRVGMRFEVKFNRSNSGAATLAVDGQGIASLKKIINGVLVELSANDLNPIGIYDLVFDGSCLQVVNGIETTASSLPQASEIQAGISRFGTTAEVLAGLLIDVGISPKTLKDKLDNYQNRETLLSIDVADINLDIRTTPNRNKYVAINENLIVGKDIRINPTIPVPATFSFIHILNFPKPLNAPTPHQPMILFSNLGNQFLLEIDVDGKVFLSGTFTNVSEELYLNLTPYVAKFPLEYNELVPPS